MKNLLHMLVAIAVSALIFVAFVPGVLVTLPPGGTRVHVLATHGALFAVLNHIVLRVLRAVIAAL
jgi:hypothetical protein